MHVPSSYIYANLRTYLLALHLHGPLFTTPFISASEFLSWTKIDAAALAMDETVSMDNSSRVILFLRLVATDGLYFKTTLYSLINWIWIVDAYSNGNVIHPILSTSMFCCSLKEMWAWNICEGRPLSTCLRRETPTFLRCHPSLRDQDCIFSAVLRFQHVFAPKNRITTVVRLPQIHGPPLGLVFY